MMDPDLGTLLRDPLPTEPGTYIQVRWRGGGAVERYVLDN